MNKVNKNNNRWTPQAKREFAEKMLKARQKKQGVSKVVKVFAKIDKKKDKERAEFIKEFDPLFREPLAQQAQKKAWATPKKEHCKKCETKITSINGLVYPETKHCIACYNEIIQKRSEKIKLKKTEVIQTPPPQPVKRSFMDRMMNIRDVSVKK